MSGPGTPGPPQSSDGSEVPAEAGRSSARSRALAALAVVVALGAALLLGAPGAKLGIGAASDPPPEASPAAPTTATTGLPATIAPSAPPIWSQPPARVGSYLLIDRAELLDRPTMGAAWSALLDVADGSLGKADLCDKDSKHAVRTLGVALVYARTGTVGYRTKARDAIMSALPTMRVGCASAILSLGRQLGAYVLAADLIELDGNDDATFRKWLSSIRTKDLGGHGRWRSLQFTASDSSNNWGAFAQASRIAASRYLGDTADVAVAAAEFHGFIGDRGSWSGWGSVSAESETWSCDPERFTPLNRSCVRDGINLDGAIAADVSRSGELSWPPGEDAKLYQIESLQGLILQAELLSGAGYPAWEWEDQALRRAAGFVTRADAWNLTPVGRHVPWLINARYGLTIPTEPAGFGRLLGYTDWLYGR